MSICHELVKKNERNIKAEKKIKTEKIGRTRKGEKEIEDRII